MIAARIRERPVLEQPPGGGGGRLLSLRDYHRERRRPTEEHTDTLLRRDRSRERSRRSRENVLVGRGRGGHGMRSLSPGARPDGEGSVRAENERANERRRREAGVRRARREHPRCTHTKHTSSATRCIAPSPGAARSAGRDRSLILDARAKYALSTLVFLGRVALLGRASSVLDQGP